MDNSKKLTPEEIASRVCNGRMNVANLLYLAEYQGRTLSGTQLMLTVDAMKQYAAQEGAAERITMDELSRQINELKQEVAAVKYGLNSSTKMAIEIHNELAEKDALLKEQLSWANIGMIDAFRGHDYRAMWDIWIKVIRNLTTGKEAGEDAKDNPMGNDIKEVKRLRVHDKKKGKTNIQRLNDKYNGKDDL